ncbi:type I DNA topoisomerase, partial [Escherichia coli]|nr:type I DNA topoisomerase [Escherichia coli]
LIDKPDETAITCPQCRTGHLVQRRSRYGKTFHSCDRCPECQFALLIEKKTAQGVKHFCASKQCGKPVSAE